MQTRVGRVGGCRNHARPLRTRAARRALWPLAVLEKVECCARKSIHHRVHAPGTPVANLTARMCSVRTDELNRRLDGVPTFSPGILGFVSLEFRVRSMDTRA